MRKSPRLKTSRTQARGAGPALAPTPSRLTAGGGHPAAHTLTSVSYTTPISPTSTPLLRTRRSPSGPSPTTAHAVKGTQKHRLLPASLWSHRRLGRICLLGLFGRLGLWSSRRHHRDPAPCLRSSLGGGLAVVGYVPHLAPISGLTRCGEAGVAPKHLC